MGGSAGTGGKRRLSMRCSLGFRGIYMEPQMNAKNADGVVAARSSSRFLTVARSNDGSPASVGQNSATGTNAGRWL